MIKITNLNKRFDGFQALTDFNIHIARGSIYGLIGTNGAGKTTIIKHLAGVLKGDSGTITFEDTPVYENADLKKRIGYIPDDLGHLKPYTLKSYGRFLRTIYPRWDSARFDLLVNTFQLNPNQKIARFSKGMQKQAAFALTMAQKPDYLLLDEPIDGLDPIVRKLVWKYVMDDVAAREMTVLISSHNLREMEGVCDSVGIISKGSMVIERELDTLKSDVHKVQVSLQEPGDDPYKGLHILHQETRGSVDLLIVRDKKEVVDTVMEKGKPIVFDMLPLSLEEIFIYELGGNNHDTILF